MTQRVPSALRPALLLALLLILLTLPLQRTFANLPTDCAACSGTDECDCDMDGTDDDAFLELPDGEDGDDEDGAGFGSLRFGVRFGRAANEGLRLGGGFSLHAVEPSALVFTPQFLQYRNRLLDRVLQTEVAPGSEASVLGADWEARLDSVSLYNRVVVSGLPSGVSHQVRLLGARREAVVFQFRHGEPEGLPSGGKAGLRLRLAMRDADGHATTSSPAYYDLVFGDGGFVRYAVADGKVVSLTTASGRTVTPQSAGLDAVYDPQSGLLRQVWSARDGLAEVAVTSAGISYEIRLYAPSQVAGRGADGLYAAAGSPHTVWRVSNPNPGFFTRVLVTRVAGGAEETTAYDYSHNAEGWTKTAPDQASVVSSSAVRDAYGLERTVDVIGRTSSGQVASHVRNTVRRHPFGERVVKSVRDPLGARLATVREYDSSGRLASESLPDGSWTRRSYDAQGRVTAVVTPWKDSAFDSPDNDAKAVLYSYSPVDGRDAVAATDARPRVEETRILGVTTSKTYHAHYAESGCRVEVLERCVRPDAEYGDADNLRTVKRWHPAGNGASSASAGRLHTVLREDGQMTTYAYEYGTWTPGADDSTPGTFVAGSGSALKITRTQGTAVHPDGVAFRTLRLVSVRDAAGNEVFTERLVYTGSGYQRLDWTAYSYDFRNRPIRERRSNGELTETTWGCCAKASETLSDGRTYLYEYDALRRLVSKTLAGVGGQPDYVTEYIYDAAGRVTATTVSGGNISLSLSSVYDLAGRLLSSTNEAGLVTNRSYLLGVNTGNLRRGETVTVTHPGGAQTITATYCDGRQTSVTGDAQVSQYFDYGVNSDGTQWSLTRIGGGDSPHWTKTTTDLLGRVVKTEKPGFGENAVVQQQNFYDAAGRLARTTRTGLAATLYEYDELGELVRTGQDADGNGTLDLASSDRITETASAYTQDNSNAWWARSTQSVYATANDATPTVVSVTDERLSGFASGVVSETRSTDIHGNTTVSTTAVNRATKTVTAESLSPESTVAEQQVTVNGLTISVRSRSNLTTAFGYDGLRRRVSVTAPRTGTSTIAYNVSGQVSAETDAAGNTTSYGYDDAGRLAWRRNALGKYARYAYNRRGQQIRVWGDTEYPVEYGYDQYGQKVTMTTFRTSDSWNGESWPNPAPQGDTTTWNYDEATGLLTSKVYADGHGPSYAYTADGKLATRTWARKDAQGNDLVTAYSYSQFDELTGIDYSDATPDITYAYSRFGKFSQVTDAVGTRTFAYNATLDEVSETIAGLYGKTLTRTYTSTGFKGRKQGLSIDNVSHYAYDYDQYGRMNQITIPSGSFNYTRLADSDLVSQMTRPNGITTTWSYETNRDLVTQVQNGTVSTYGYVNDAIGRRTSMSRSGSAYANPDIISYTYNDRSELTGAQSNVDSTYSYSYAYDPIGNRTTASEAGVPWTYTTNSLNQYTSASEGNTQLSFSYDLDGSMTSRPIDATGGWTQVWNGENRMVETYKGTDRLTFRYDYMGRRVEKCVFSGNTLTSNIYYVYDDFKCIEELDKLNNNVVITRHTWQPSDAGVDIILATSNMNNFLYYLHDNNKNIMQTIMENGTINDTYTYAPFGAYLGTKPNMLGFSSECFDTENNLLCFIFREYDPIYGKWNQLDPLENVMERMMKSNSEQARVIALNVISSGISVSENLYNFANNSPIYLFDMLGLSCQVVRFTIKKETPRISLGPIKIKGVFDSNTDVKTCDVTCCGQNAKSIETKEQIRGSLMLEYSAPTPIPAVTVQVSGGGFVAGEILTKYDPCTNKNTKDGCVNYGARGSIAGCTGSGAKACLGGNFFWSRKKCVNEPTKTCYGGGFFVEACFIRRRCYRWWFWQESKCSNE